MRIFKSSLLIVAHLLCLSLPTAGAPGASGLTDTEIQVNHVLVAEGSGDTTIKDSRTSFLESSYIIESTQNAYLQTALRVTGAVQALVAPEPPPSHFWEMAVKYEKALQDYVPRLLENAAKKFESTKFTDITGAMHHIVIATATFRDNIKGVLDVHQITIDALTEELEGIFMQIANDLEKIPPPDQAPSHTERAEMVDKVLNDTEQALINLAIRYGIDEEVVTNFLHVLKPQVQALTVAVGDINEQHPELLPALAFGVAALLIPESWILRPLLSLFGFGPMGPIKGSAAAWLQRRFWGAAVKAGSWFAYLQAAGMGRSFGWAWLATLASIMGGLWAILPCFRRG